MEEPIPVSEYRTANLDWLGYLTFGASTADRLTVEVDGGRDGWRATWGPPPKTRIPLHYIIKKLLDMHQSDDWNHVHLEAARKVIDKDGRPRRELLYEKTIPRVATAGEHSLEDVLRRLQGIRQGLRLQVHVLEKDGIFYTVPTSDWVHLVALFNREFRIPTKVEPAELVTGIVSL